MEDVKVEIDFKIGDEIVSVESEIKGLTDTQKEEIFQGRFIVDHIAIRYGILNMWDNYDQFITEDDAEFIIEQINNRLKSKQNEH